MPIKRPLLHLFMVPILTLLVANGLSLGVLQSLTWSNSWLRLEGFFWLSHAAYGGYLLFFRSSCPRTLGVYLFSLLFSALLLLSAPAGWVILGFQILLFSLMRSFIFKKSLTQSGIDLMYTSVGVIGALFLYPISLFLAVMVFFTLQMMGDLGTLSATPLVFTDSFEKHHKMAEEVLQAYGG